MAQEYLLSVVIPTRNREVYACNAVKQILNQCDKRIQVVLQNNSDTNGLKSMLQPYIEDGRLKYNYTSKRLSGVDNFNQGVSLCDGEYLVVIGDDDGINPQIIECVEWMKRERVDVVKPAISLGYNWPANNVGCINKLKTALVTIERVNGKRKICNPKEGVIMLLKNGGQNYLQYEIAKSYHGIVSRECMDKVKVITGKYYGGLSPDIFSAVALSLLENIRMVEINYPFTISGVCYESTSAASANNKHVGTLSEAPHFAGQENYIWEPEVPRLYSVQTIWAETAIKAARESGSEDLVKQYFSLEKLVTHIVVNNWHCRKMLFHNIDEKYNSIYYKCYFKISRKIYCVYRFVTRLRKFIRRKAGIDYIQYGVNDLLVASEIIGKKMNEPRMKKALNTALSELNE